MTMLMRLRAFVVGSAALVSLSACGDDSGDPVQPVNGTLVVNVAGLPAGTNSAVTVTGPAAYNRALTTTSSISVPAGTYSVTASEVTVGATRYAATISGSPATVGSN